MLIDVNERLSDAYGKEKGILAQYMDYLYEVKRKSADTAYNYYMTLRSLAKFLSHQRGGLGCDPDEVVLQYVSVEDMTTITKDEWWDYLDYYQFTRKGTKGSMAVRISIVRGFYTWLAEELGLPSVGYVINTKRPPVQRKSFVPVTDRMMDVLCDNLEGENAIRNTCIVKMFLRCGLGLQEICDLDLEDIELKSLRVRGHNDKKREVPLDAATIAAVNEYIEVRTPPTDGSNAFFVSAKKGRMRRGTVQKMLRKAVSHAGPNFTAITARDLQMTAKSRMVQEKGVDQAAAATNIESRYYFKYAYGQFASTSLGTAAAH